MKVPHFFEGVVAEDPSSELGLETDSPQTGRVLVRELLGHSNRVASEDLPPAYIIMPSNSAGIGGVGMSPTGLLKGSRVMCVKFPDQAAPYILGVLNYAPEDNHSVSSFARGQGEPEAKTQNRIKGEGGSTIEPNSQYKARYPFNNTMTTRSGHLLEFDDTPGAERVQIFHKSGSYIEILPDGTIVTKSVKDHIQIAFGNISIFNQGDGDGGKDIEITSNQGQILLTSSKDISIFADSGNVGVFANSGSVSITSKSGVIDQNAPKIGLNCGDI
jgi:hypothetical protein